MKLDVNGFIVLCSEKGLFRFDGSTFSEIPWASKMNDEILAIRTDEKKQLWGIGLNNVVYKIEKDTITPILKWTKDPKTIFNFFVHEGKVWLSSNSPFLYNYDIETKKLDSIDISYKIPKEKKIQRVSPIYISKERILFSNSFLDQTDIIRSYLFQSNEVKELTSKGISESSILVQHQENLFLIKRLNFDLDETLLLSKDTLLAYSKLSDQINTHRTIRTSSSRSHLFLCGRGLKIISNNLDEDFHLLSESTITSCIVIDHKNLWVSTLDQGLYFFPNYTSNTLTLEESETKKEVALTELESTNSTLIIASKRGNIYTLSNDSLSEYYNNKRGFSAFLKKSIYLDKEEVYFANEEKVVSIETNSSDPTSLDIGSASIKDFSIWGKISLNSSLLSSSFQILKKDKKLAYLFLPKDHIERNIQPSEDKKNHVITLTNTRSHLNLINPFDSSLWVATRTELIRFTKHTIDTIKVNNGNSIITTMDFDRKGIVWIGTPAGIFSFKGATPIPTIDYLKVLQNIGINRINARGKSILIATDQGLFRITNKLTQISTLDGLASNITTDAIEIDSTLFVATEKGLNVFKKYNSLLSNKIPKIRCTKLKVNDNLINSNSELNLSHFENTIELSLGGLALNSPGSLIYFYRLNGIENEWNETKNPLNIRYPNLNNGNYIFEAYIIDYFGNKSNTLQLQIKIAPPFWKTIWFWALIILLVSFIFYKIVSNRISRINLQKKLIQSEIEGLKSQINPHFIFNALNSIQDLIIKSDVENSNLYLGKFALLLRSVLNYSSQKEITLTEEIDLLQVYLDLEKLRFKDSLTATIIVDAEISKYELSLPPLILQPYVENALKHGLLHSDKPNKTLEIKFSISNNSLLCQIIDNGIGRTASNKINERRSKHHQSFASTATEKRIDLINQNRKKPIQLKIDDLIEGTSIELTFPIEII